MSVYDESKLSMLSFYTRYTGTEEHRRAQFGVLIQHPGLKRVQQLGGVLSTAGSTMHLAASWQDVQEAKGARETS